jgi:thiosulfate/3-mercaptopyruvate sulfurtransferase
LDEIDPRWLSDRESLLIVDTTPYVDSYKKHHIPYAAHFEFPMEEMNELNGKTRAEFEKILGPDRHRKMVFYSESAKCGCSHNGAMWAVSLGYTNVYRYRQGIKEWMEAGNKTETAR